MKTKEEILEDQFGHAFGLLHPIIHLANIEAAMQTFSDQENAELKEKVEELGGQSILDTMQRNKALRDKVAQLQSEIASLRSRLDECRRKQMTNQ